MGFSDIKNGIKKLKNFISFFDVYKTFPILNAKAYSRYQTKIGTLLTISFIFLIFAIYLTAVVSYFRKDCTQIVSNSLTYNLSQTTKRYVTNKNFYAYISIRQKLSGLQVDPTYALKNFMSAYLIIANQTTNTQYIYNLEQGNCSEYTNNFEGARKDLKYCLTLPDDVQMYLSSYPLQVQQGVMYFAFRCTNLMLCNGNYYNALFNQYLSFWVSNTFDLYFTTRKLDQNNNIVYMWNIASSSDYIQTFSTVNFISIALSNLTYYVDDSIIPWKNNRTYILQIFNDDRGLSQIPLAMTQNYGVQIIFYNSNKQFVSYRYYSKIDSLLGMLGGGIFILFLIFRCGGNRYNRYRYQMSLTNSLYILSQNKELQMAKLSILDTLVFIPYRYLGIKNYQWFHKYQYFRRLQNYQQIFETSKYDTDIINLKKREKLITRNLERLTNFKQNSTIFKRVLVKQLQEQKSQQIKYFSPEQSKMLEITGLNSSQYNTLINIHPSIKQAYFQKDPVYQKIFNDKQLALNPVHSKKFIKNEQSTFFYFIKKFLRYFDIFKVSPSFTLETKQMHGTGIGALCTITAVILSILTFYIGFQYFVNPNNIKISTQYYNAPSSNIQISVNTSKNFKFALCFQDKVSLNINQLQNEFSTQMLFQIIQFVRIGNQVTNSTYPMVLVGDMNYFLLYKSLLSPTFVNCYKPPDNLILQIQGSPNDYVQKYFSIRLSQHCYNPDNNQCILAFGINRQKILQILNNKLLQYFMIKTSYNLYQDAADHQLLQGYLFQQRGLLNSSVRQQLLVDQLRIVDDNSIWRDQQQIRGHYITTTYYYNNNADILPQDNKELFYQLDFRPTGYVNIYRRIGPKFDIIFGMIGGIFLFIFGFFGFFTYLYNRLMQKLYLGFKIFQIKNNENKFKSNFLKEWLYILMYPFKLFMRENRFCQFIYPIKKIHDKIDEIYSLQFITKKHEIINRQIFGITKDQKYKQLNQIYLKQNFNSGTINDEQQKNNEEGFRERQLEKDGRNRIINEHQQQNSEVNQQNVAENNDQKGLRTMKKRKLRKIKDTQKIMEQQKEEIVNHKSFKQQSKNEQQIININEQNLVKQLKQRRLTNYQLISNKIHNLICYFDMFGTGGQLSFQGSIKFGSWISGLCSIAAIILIILIIKYYGLLYLTGANYIVSRKYANINTFDFYQKFTTGKDFKFAIGYINRTYSALLDISPYVSHSQPLFKIMIIQSIVNRTNKNTPIYSQIIYNMVPCPNNYLNDGIYRFDHFITSYNIQSGYCLPDNIILQFQGDKDSPIQKWFVASIAVNCNNLTNCTNQISLGKQFFSSNIMKFFTSSPIINTYPQKYRFIEQVFITQVPSYCEINNLTIIPTEYIQYDSIYPWNNPPVLNTYEYIYRANQQNKQYFVLSNSNILFKNITFDFAQTKTTYIKNITKIDSIFGLVGGIIGFIMFCFGIFAYNFNRFQMHYEIGRRLYIVNSVEITSLQLFLYLILYYTGLSICLEKRIKKLQLVIKIIQKTKKQLNIISYFKKIFWSSRLLERLLSGNEKKLLDVYIKKLIQDTDPDLPMKKVSISPVSIKEIQILLEKYELSPYQIMIIYKFIEKKQTLVPILGQQAQFLNKFIKIQQKLAEYRVYEGQNKLEQKNNESSVQINKIVNESYFQHSSVSFKEQF